MVLSRSTPIFLVLCLFLSACGVDKPTPSNFTVPSIQSTEQQTKIISATVQPILPATSSTKVLVRSSQDEDNIREVLLRYRFAQLIGNPSYPTSNFYCLGFETTSQSPSNLIDVPQPLLDRFGGSNPPVVKASECAMVQDKVVLISSGEQAIFWGIGTISWSGDNKASLEISYLYGFNGTGGTLFQLERTNGSWKVTGSILTWTA